MKHMRVLPISLFTVLIAALLVVPAISGCEMVASYLLYDWLQNEFDGNSNPDSEDPVILKISADKETIYTGDMVTLEVEAEDNQDSASDLEYFWFASAGTMASPTSSITIWNAPDDPGTVTVSVIVTDTDGNKDSATVEIEVIE
jgi:hypothetical protein